jgi:hypothetical protein
MIRIGPSSMLDIGPRTLGNSHIGLTALQSDVSGMYIVAEFTKKFRNRGTERLAVWRSHAIEAQNDTEPTLLLSPKEIKHFLGIFEHSIVFLDHHLWVCSIDLLSLRPRYGSISKDIVKKHFSFHWSFWVATRGTWVRFRARVMLCFLKKENLRW